MLRRFANRLVYVLIAALLLAQQGLALHVLSHGVDALKIAKQDQPDPRSLPADRHCDLCLTYAQVAAGAAAATPFFAALAPDHAVSPATALATRTVTARAYRSRAPPRLA
jgi:hypothetical protein